jgi:NADH dehydrogenase [ubiquinone] 1 alpha subcomplex assembly factor 8
MLAAVAKERGNPLKRLAYHSTKTCSAQAAVYGQCIVATYKDVTKEACKDEFLLFKRCLEKAVCFIFFLFHAIACVHRFIDEESLLTGLNLKIVNFLRQYYAQIITSIKISCIRPSIPLS